MFYEHDVLDIESDQESAKLATKNIVQNESIKFLNLMKRANTRGSLELEDDLIED
jgi:hypothetical protein